MKIIQIIGVTLLAVLVLIVGVSAGLYWLREVQRAVAAHEVMEQYEQDSLERDRDRLIQLLGRKHAKWFAEASTVCARVNKKVKANPDADYYSAAYANAHCDDDKSFELYFKRQIEEARTLPHDRVKVGLSLAETF